MNVLVTGGTGLVGGAVVPALVRRGHRVRIVSRHASAAAMRLADAGTPVEAADADVTAPGSLRGIADGCDAVVHLVGVIDADEPRRYDLVNDQGTRSVVEEAARAGVRRFVHVSALGAERDTTPYRSSKRRGERHVEAFGGEWVVLRPGGVIGPKDQVVTLLLRMLRASPVVPVVGDGRQRMQLVWHEDLGAAIVAAVERPDVARRVLDVAGDEVTTSRDLLERLGRLIGRTPRFVSVPPRAAPLASKAVAGLGLTPPLNEEKLAMLLEGSVIEPPSRNALRDLVGAAPTSLDAALRALRLDLPLQPPSAGFGPVHHKRYRARVAHPARTPEEVIEAFRARCLEVMPLDFHAEPGGARRLDEGATLALRVPLRGNMLMRVVETAPREVTMATVEGHAIAGLVRFRADGARDALGFAVEIFARPSNQIDRAALGLFGSVLQDLHWRRVAKQGARLAGGGRPGRVAKRAELLHGAEARRIEDTVAALARNVESPDTMA